MVKKPVPKRKGYAEGGSVGGYKFQIDKDDQLGETFDRSAKTDSDRERFRAARGAETSALYNRMSPEGQKSFLEDTNRMNTAVGDRSVVSGRKFAQERADYPGFAKGGPVKKPLFEGSKKDLKQDKAGAKKMGVSMKAYERTPKDKAQDKAGQRQMFGKRK
jgi:hypothetical protein